MDLAQTSRFVEPPARVPRVRASRRSAPCTLYGLLLAALAAALFVVSVHGTAPLAEPHLPWWAIAVGFVVAEACVVHLEFRRSAHSFSLADIPFVFGLVFASGDDFLAGALLGTGVVYAFRRLAPVKLVFNLAQLALVACVAVVIVHALAVPGDALEPRDLARALRRDAGDGRSDHRLHRRRDRDRRGRA